MTPAIEAARAAGIVFTIRSYEGGRHGDDAVPVAWLTGRACSR